MRSKLAPLWNIHRSVEILRCVRETDQWLPVTGAYLGFHKLRYPYSLHIRGMQPVILQEVSDVWAFWQIFMRRVYDVAGDEETIVDAGANIGFFTLWAARLAPNSRVFAIEPVPESYRRLCENVNRNGLEHRVTCLNCALGGVAETRMVKVGKARSQAQRVVAFDPKSQVTFASVATETLVNILDNQGIKTIDLLKMDIEGGEYETLFSVPPETLRRIRRVTLEYHPDVEGYTTGQLLTFFQGSGFTLKRNICNREGYGLALLENGSATHSSRKAS